MTYFNAVILVKKAVKIFNFSVKLVYAGFKKDIMFLLDMHLSIKISIRLCNLRLQQVAKCFGNGIDDEKVVIGIISSLLSWY